MGAPNVQFPSSGNLPAKPRAFSPAPVKLTDSLTIAEYADLFGFPAAAVAAAVERQRGALNKPFYSIPDLAKRWLCSRATVYEVLRQAGYKIVHLTRNKHGKGKKLIPRHVVEKIEKDRSDSLDETR
jgi:hypothetical protein